MSTCQLSFNTSLGFISIIENQGRITHIKFQKIANKKPSLRLQKAKYEIRQFLNKKRKRLTFKTNITGSKNQLRIWRQIKKIPYGKCISYKDISKQTKIHPRLVGKICGENRLPLYIPCHRIIRSDGSLGGYSARGGINLKKKLLKIEKLNK
jgi:methylated-DNA-[protein]-cysteine S-methyltransferase